MPGKIYKLTIPQIQNSLASMLSDEEPEIKCSESEGVSEEVEINTLEPTQIMENMSGDTTVLHSQIPVINWPIPTKKSFSKKKSSITKKSFNKTGAKKPTKISKKLVKKEAIVPVSKLSAEDEHNKMIEQYFEMNGIDVNSLDIIYKTSEKENVNKSLKGAH